MRIQRLIRKKVKIATPGQYTVPMPPVRKAVILLRYNSGTN
jgi:hypothetical protein